MRRLVNDPIRRHDSVQKLEWFLISAIAMILVIRTQLWLTNYPQLGGGGLHIAHLLYGGVFMLIAIWLRLIYLNRWSASAAAIVGGIGFGFFIDELGKFITEDNDYFFKPAAALIYLVFIGLFLAIREISRRQSLGPEAALANAMSFLPATITGEFRREERDTVTELLGQADPADPRVARIRALFEEATVAPTRPPSRLALLLDRLHARIAALTKRPRFGPVVTAIVILWGVGSLLGLVEIRLELGDDGSSDFGAGVDTGLLAVGSAISTFVSGVLVVLGAYWMRKEQHQKAYRYFMRALLVSIFVTRVFAFVDSQFGAVFGLALDILLYAAIGELASQDAQRRYRFAGIGPAAEGEPVPEGAATRQTVPDGQEEETAAAEAGPGQVPDQ